MTYICTIIGNDTSCTHGGDDDPLDHNFYKVMVNYKWPEEVILNSRNMMVEVLSLVQYFENRCQNSFYSISLEIYKSRYVFKLGVSKGITFTWYADKPSLVHGEIRAAWDAKNRKFSIRVDDHTERFKTMFEWFRMCVRHESSRDALEYSSYEHEITSLMEFMMSKKDAISDLECNGHTYYDKLDDDESTPETDIKFLWAEYGDCLERLESVVALMRKRFIDRLDDTV